MGHPTQNYAKSAVLRPKTPVLRLVLGAFLGCRGGPCGGAGALWPAKINRVSAPLAFGVRGTFPALGASYASAALRRVVVRLCANDAASETSAPKGGMRVYQPSGFRRVPRRVPRHWERRSAGDRIQRRQNGIQFPEWPHARNRKQRPHKAAHLGEQRLDTLRTFTANESRPYHGMTIKGRIMSCSSCSRMWQCHT